MKSEKVLNYRVHMEQEMMGKKMVYNAYCPTLGLSDFGSSIDEALKRITDLIEFHIETLTQLGRSVPIDRDTTTVITSVQVPQVRGFHASL